MTIAQIILLVIILVMLAFVLLQQVVRRGFKLLFLLFILFGALIVIFPELSTKVASYAGIGRGADMVLYFMAVLNIGMLLLVWIRTALINRDITMIIRKMALQHPLEPKQD